MGKCPAIIPAEKGSGKLERQAEVRSGKWLEENQLAVIVGHLPPLPPPLALASPSQYNVVIQPLHSLRHFLFPTVNHYGDQVISKWNNSERASAVSTTWQRKHGPLIIARPLIALSWKLPFR